MDFKQADEKFKQLKARYEAGELTEGEFKSQLLENMVQDEQGDWWVIGYETERWYRHDGTSWVQTDPPGMQSQAIPAGAERPAEPTIEEEPVTKTGIKDSSLEREKPVLPPGPEPSGPVAEPAAGRPAGTWVLIAAGVLLAGICLLVAVPRLINLLSPPATATQMPAPTEGPAAAAETFTQVPASSGDILFQDDFSGPNSRWRTFAGTDISALYSADGRYVMRATSNAEFWINAGFGSDAGQNFTDVSVEVDAAKTVGADANQFGVICRYQNEQNFYYLYVSSNGHLLIGKRVDGKFTPLSGDFDQSSTDAVLAGDVTNHLRADCTGSTLTLFANGQQVGSVTDASLSSGDVGLIMGNNSGSNVEISFDNFVVRAAQGAGVPSPTEAPAATEPSTQAASDCNAAEYVQDVTIPDNTPVAPNRPFTKTWRIKNIGTCTWTPSYLLVFHSGNSMNGPLAQVLPGDVPPGQAVDISVNLTAPAAPGEYTAFYKLSDPSGQPFGVAGLYVQIIVTPLTLTAGPQILFQDDFSDANSGWFTGSDKSWSVGYSTDGVYVINAFVAPIYVWATPAGQTFTDVSVEVDATNYSGSNDTYFGAICRYQDRNNFYYFFVNGGRFFIIGVKLDGKFQVLSSGKALANVLIRAGTGINHLRADCQGSSLNLYANGELLDSTSDTSFTSGDVGLIIESIDQSHVGVSFDNFVVYPP